MIRYSALGFVSGQFLLVFALSMLLPIGVGIAYQDSGLGPLAGTAGGITALGLLLLRFCPRPLTDLSLREGILLVVVLWTAVMLMGAIPFALDPAFASFADALFESTSGFTTTGATILPDVEVLPPSIQMWRHFSHWLGGVGIILLAIAILPLLGIGSMALYRAQAGNVKSERIKPRVIETARTLWRFYVAGTLFCYIALRLAGMNWFDAICHTFSTLATGGFSTMTASVGAFNSPLMEYILVVFMVLASLNFTVHYRAVQERSPFAYFRDIEFKVFLAILGLVTFLIMVNLMHAKGYAFEFAFRRALFQVVSLGSTTGFATENYDLWSPFPQMLLLFIGCLGGNAGSTAGGIKSFRVHLILSAIKREFQKIVERRGVFAIRIHGEVVQESQVQSALTLFALIMLTVALAAAMLGASGLDFYTSISAATACMFSVGPGFGSVGPAENYAHVPTMGKLVLSFCMLAGRLEFFTLLLVFSPAFWRK